MAFGPDRGAGSHGHGPTTDPAPAPAPPIIQSQHHQFSRPRHAHTRSTASGRMRSSSRVSDFEIWDGLDGLDGLQHVKADSSSSDDEDIHPPGRSQRPGHSRSMSHPFPSLFSSGRKKQQQQHGADRSSGGVDRSSSDSDFEPLTASSKAGGRDATNPNPGPLPPPMRGHRNGSSVGSRGDFVTGQCMTCASLVRWPSELSVFKCTICLTINDLQPLDRAPKGRDGQGGGDGLGETISLGHTKELVEQCLRTFLVQTLTRQTPTDGDGDDAQVSQTPSPISPGENRIPARPSGTPSARRPDVPGSRSRWLLPDGNRGRGGPSRHGRSPSWANPMPTSPSMPFPERPPLPFRGPPPQGAAGNQQKEEPAGAGTEPKRIFKPLEDYIVKCFTSFHRLNYSFMPPRKHPHAPHAVPEANNSPRQPPEPRPEPRKEQQTRKEPQVTDYTVPELEPKLLLLGDVAENGMWWTGGQEEVLATRITPSRSQNGPSVVSSRNPRIDFVELEEWYRVVLDAAQQWSRIYQNLVYEQPALAVPTARLHDIEAQILVAQEHTHRTLLKACEMMLKRPSRRITAPQYLRFILIIAANPLLQPTHKPYAGKFPHQPLSSPKQTNSPSRTTGPSVSRHSGIIKRIVGLLSNAPTECHNNLVAWLARYPEPLFIQTKELVSSFLAFRLLRQNEKKYEGAKVDIIGGLVPSMAAGQSPASLHAALGQGQSSSSAAAGPGSGSGKKQKEKKKRVMYREDWQIRAAAQVLGFLFAANNMGHARRGNGDGSNVRTRGGLHHQQVLPTSDFYVTLLDDSDLVADFEAWEQRKSGRFAFCQYPFLLSIGAKIQILEHDARRQMENKARDAFFDSILSNRVVQQFLVLNIRRECLVEDSLRAVSEVVGGGGEDVKKGLKIVFKGEEGVDAGGLRKEWFLLLVRELFNPDHGMFLYDEDSHYCYFNPNSLEPSEQFFLVGVVLGLAIYNSTILDVALPPFAFRKLVLAAPAPSIATSQPRQAMSYSLEDLAEYRPSLARGLGHLLHFDGADEEFNAAFGGDDFTFTIDVERYGAMETVPLCPGGERRVVTKENRREYVDAYVRYLLDTTVTRQFEPFKRGFFTVCGGNALSLFRPEEIELLVRGSGAMDEPIDVRVLRGVAVYDGWEERGQGQGMSGNSRVGEDLVETEPTLRWFWESFEHATPRDQRRLLAFVTGSDRLPAMGAASLAMRISCLGDDCGRFPTARTCFNALALWRCGSKERLEEVLWRAVGESEGFGLK